MPKIKVNDIEMYYEVQGAGEPLVLIAGLGYGVWSWYQQVPAFSPRYKVISFDNRGAGATDKPDMPYSIKMLADDLAALLARLQIQRAHVLGVSMGGFIAQQLALDYPDTVKSLVLGCTSFGGKKSVLPPPATWKTLLETDGLTSEAIVRRAHSFAFSADYFKSHPDEMEHFTRLQLANPVPRDAWLRQFWAGAGFDSEARVAEIRVPTLIVTGTADRIVPPENATRLAAKIESSQRITLDGAGHVFFIERAADFNDIVLRFLEGPPRASSRV